MWIDEWHLPERAAFLFTANGVVLRILWSRTLKEFLQWGHLTNVRLSLESLEAIQLCFVKKVRLAFLLLIANNISPALFCFQQYPGQGFYSMIDPFLARPWVVACCSKRCLTKLNTFKNNFTKLTLKENGKKKVSCNCCSQILWGKNIAFSREMLFCPHWIFFDI